MCPHVCWALLLLLTGCRGAGELADPIESPRPPADPAGSVAPVKEASPEPEPEASVEPVPPPAPFVAEASIDVAGRPVGVRIDQQPSADPDASPTTTLLVSIDGATQGDHLIAIPTGFEGCERVEAVVEPVSGKPSPLVLAQAFCESGEDEFSRTIVTAVIDIGDDTSAQPLVTWKGGGSFSSSFGVCLRTDVPLATVPRPGILVVEQMTEVEHMPDRDLSEIRCRAKKARTVKTAEIGF